MEVLLVRAAVPFPCPRRSQKPAEVSEPQKARAQSKFLMLGGSTENPSKAPTVPSLSSRVVNPQAAQVSGFPLKFPWFKGGKKEGGGDATTTAAACGEVASLALSAAHDGITTPLSDEEKRTVHEVLSTLQSSATELTALEVASLKPLGSDDTVAEVVPSAIGSEELAKAEAEIAKSWLHNFMRIRSLWNIRQFNTNTKVLRKQTPDSIKQSGAAVLEQEGAEKPEEGLSSSDSVDSGDVGESMGCVCEECCVDAEDDMTAPAEEEGKEIAHIKIVHDRESFSKFLQSVPMSELKTVSHLASLCNLAYVIPTIKPGNLLKHHGLRFVTSSFNLKTRKEKAAMEKAAKEAAAKESALAKELEDSLATSEASSAKEADAVKLARIFPFMRKAKTLVESTAYQKQSPTDPADELCMECKTKLEALQEAEPSSTIPDITKISVVNQDTEQTASGDVQPSYSCPCEWFICDDDLSKIRNFTIQGSDSLASWVSNLLFEPTRFEDPKLGVMVHRGIYEAAQALYEDILPYVLEHVQKYGSEAKIRFTGHSLGGSLGILVSLMLRARDTAPLSSLLPVYTFGSPFVLCGGDHLLQQLGFPQNHVQMVVMHRDIVPRSFTCTYPDLAVGILNFFNGTFRGYSCLHKQRFLYAPMGVMRVIQPPPTQSPGHPFLPVGSGIYDLRHPSSVKLDTSDSGTLLEQSVELRAAQRAFLNNPHPLDILWDRSSLGSGGGISRDHDPRSYKKAVNYVLKQEQRKIRRTHKTADRVQLTLPSLATESGVEFIEGVVLKGLVYSENSVNSGECGSLGAASSGMGATSQVLRRSGRLNRSISSARDTITSGSTMDRLSRYSRLIASKHIHIGMLLLVSVRVILMQGLATFIA